MQIIQIVHDTAKPHEEEMNDSTSENRKRPVPEVVEAPEAKRPRAEMA